MTRISITSAISGLTPRQGEVCALLLQGMSNKEVARQLGISPRTIEDHRCEIYKLAGVHNMLAIAYRVYGSPEITA